MEVALILRINTLKIDAEISRFLLDWGNNFRWCDLQRVPGADAPSSVLNDILLEVIQEWVINALRRGV
jgi:hypothetical protein